jgi:GNAT superfamily N-acetyltransferase
MELEPLARALGLPVDLMERAAEELHAEKAARRLAGEVLEPHMREAREHYLRKGERLMEAAAAARLR